jgi:excisionase family DNA binding protein
MGQNRRTGRDASSDPQKCEGCDVLLRIRDVAKIMGVVPKTVRAWINAKKLVAVRDGRIIRVTSIALEDYIRKHMQ